MGEGRGPTLEELLLAAARDVEVAAGDGVRGEEAPLWVPFPSAAGRGVTLPDGRVVSPQEAALESPADELFFGGAPGGGKSDLILGLALTAHRNSIIYRQEFTQFRGAEGLVARSQEVIGLRGSLNRTLLVWSDLPGGRALEFGAAKTWSDAQKYKGRAHDLKAFDELPEFPEAVYRFLIGWLRTGREGQRTRVVSTGNPPMNEEGMWVVRYWGPWLDPAHPRPAAVGELRWYVVGDDGHDQEVPGPTYGWARAPRVQVQGRWVLPRSRTFIQSQVEDNPVYMRTGYVDVLDALPEPLRSQLRFGNFQAARGDHPWQVIPTAWVLAAQARWRPDGGLGKLLTRAGTDPSRGGKDEFVTALVYDSWIAPLVVAPAREAPDGGAGAGLVWRAVGGDRSVPIHIDIEGEAGTAVYDHAKALGLQAVAMRGSGRSAMRDRSGKLGFVNKRAEWHWRLREALDPAWGAVLALPPDPQLRADLCAVRWEITPRGIKIEDKQGLIDRLGRSPDRGDAVIYGGTAEPGYGLLFDTGSGDAALEDEVAELERRLGLRP